MKKITLMLGLVLPFAAFAQDTCAGATLISAGPTQTVAGVDGTEIPSPDCSGDQTDTTAAEWYMFAATVNGVATVNTDLPQNVDGDTRVYIYSGVCGALECLAFNDDVDVAGGNYLSNVTFPVTAGETYYIAFDDYWSADGFDFTLEELAVDCTTSLPFSTMFESANDFAACYGKFDGDANGVSWIQQFLDLNGDGTDESFATNGTNGDTPKDDWLFTPAFTMEEGKTYNIMYTFNAADADITVPANETLTTYITNEASATATLQTEVATNEGITQQGTFDELQDMAYEATGTFTAPASGNYYLAFRTTSPANSAFLLLFSFSIEESLSTPGFNAGKISVYPNPMITELAIVNQNAIDAVEIYNLVGQKVAGQAFNSNDVRMNVSDLSAGAYMVKVISGNNTQTLKVIKQ